MRLNDSEASRRQSSVPAWVTDWGTNVMLFIPFTFLWLGVFTRGSRDLRSMDCGSRPGTGRVRRRTGYRVQPDVVRRPHHVAE